MFTPSLWILLFGALVLANPFSPPYGSVDARQSLNERRQVDDQSTDDQDSDLLLTDASSKSPSAFTDLEIDPDHSSIDDGTAFIPTDSSDISLATDSQPGPVDLPPVADLDLGFADASDPSNVADCGSDMNPTSKRDVSPSVCPLRPIPNASRKFTNVPRVRKGGVIKRPLKTISPVGPGDFDSCGELSKRPGYEVNHLHVSCGGPIVGDGFKPTYVFNCVQGNRVQPVDKDIALMMMPSRKSKLHHETHLLFENLQPNRILLCHL